MGILRNFYRNTASALIRWRFTAISGTVVLVAAMIFMGVISPIGIRQNSVEGTPSNDFNFVAAGDFGCSSHPTENPNDPPGTTEKAREVFIQMANHSPEIVLGLGDYSYQGVMYCWNVDLDYVPTIHDAMHNPSTAFKAVALGNHEDECDEATTGPLPDPPDECTGRLNVIGRSEFLNHFSMTESATYYSFNYKGVHFLALDPNKDYDSSSDQYDFVVDDLAAISQNTSINWIVVFFHQPMYMSECNCGVNMNYTGPSNPLRETYQPLFDRYRVDLVLQAHVHAYERLNPMTYNAKIEDANDFGPYNDPRGQIYVTVGNGGRDLSNWDTANRPAMYAAQDDDHWGFFKAAITNDGKTLTGAFIDIDGASHDPFVITHNGKYIHSPYYTFSGSNYTDVSSSSLLQLSSFTVASWFQTSKNYTTEWDKNIIVNKGGFGSETAGQNMNYGIWVECGTGGNCVSADAGKIQAGFETSTGTNVFVKSNNKVNDGRWHYAVLTFDNTGNSMKLYIDGTAQPTSSPTSDPDSTGAQPLRIGADSSASGRFFIGNADEVRVWNRALSSTEVSNAYNGVITTNGLVAYVAPTNDAGAVYRSNSNSVMYREWNGTNWASSQVTLPTTGSDIRDAKIYQSPISRTKLVLSHSADGTLNLFECESACTVASNWVRVSGASIADTGTPSSTTPYLYFDGAFETTTGRFIVVYDKNAQESNDFYYRTFVPASNTLSAESGYNYTGASFDAEEIRYFRLASNPTSGEIVMVLHDASNLDAYAFVWNAGTSSWGNRLQLSTDTSGVTQEIGVAYEQQSTAAVVFSSKGAGAAAWARWSGGSWSAVQTTDPVSGVSNERVRYTTMKSDPDPASNKIMICTVTVVTVGIQCAKEDNGTMGSWAKVLIGNTGHNGRRSFDFAWDPQGSTGIIVYQNVSGSLKYKTWSGSSWGSEQSKSVAALSTWITGDENENAALSSTKSLWMKLNGNNDIGALTWNGSTLTLIGDNTFTSDTGSNGQVYEGMGLGYNLD